ncbi:hypothetical protein COV13_01310 [Candidatus Woesearchaeota archaeon CG10_big_fil_rev_8_21_14_0_10_32_9]|nr:MAG: hypothetical protein COV13_01310 [Candidatus Woesearchaeota archaeon CG10_big_fil_rev_8_21_14_0_10_32_9]
MHKLLESISNTLLDDFENEFVLINGTRHFLKNEFLELSTGENNSFCFIDGGNGEIVGSSAFSLNYNKISQVFFSGTKYFNSKTESFFSLSKKTNSKISFETEPEKNFDNLTEEVSCYDACCIIRSCSELDSATHVSNCSSIVLDGSFDADKYCKPFFDVLKQKCLSSKTILLGVSKTSGFVTSKGRPISFVLNELNKNNHEKWFYSSELIQDGFETCFVKLHPKSEHILRVDFLSEQKDLLKIALENLSLNCSDPVFFGYPFGLIMADDFARVSKQEVSELKAEAFVKLGKNSDLVEEAAKSSDAHAVLDKAKF